MTQEPRMSFHLMCDMLVDQKRTIGDDPVGYKCMGPAKYESPEGFLICESCLEIFSKSPARITLPSIFGKEVQIDAVDRALSKISYPVDLHKEEIERVKAQQSLS